MQNNNSKLSYFILGLNLIIFFYSIYNRITLPLGEKIFFAFKIPIIKTLYETKVVYNNFSVYFKDIKKLKKEILKLKEENSLLKVKLFLKNKECDENYLINLIPANVSAKCFSNTMECVFIDVGEIENVFEGMGVINKDGIVGIVIKSYKNFSKILLLTDINFHINVKFKNKNIQGLLTGIGNGLCMVKYLPLTEKLKKGEIVLTSNFSEIFPKNIPVGKVIEIKKNNLYKYCIIKPFIDVNILDKVFVVKNE